MEAEARKRNLPIPKILISEQRKLNEKAKKMADRYSWVVFKYRSIGNKIDANMKSAVLFRSKILQNDRND